ncbi:hypothetical protein [Caldimonas brevitalea]|uniref:Type III secretion protein D n=1 Tax=Caldimonas brevitalea TaxID=413882 RepID=A0A0G3BEK9_9BURK|nr:hypothetical protein [Caldimonas brevitalea]AKJ27834.1 type III secretion protein D [Caldimonas brevitalea]
MKRLRILTGRHIGAALDLTPGTYLIGPGDDCDLTITDWTLAPVRLQIDADGKASVHYLAPAGDDAADGDQPADATYRQATAARVERREALLDLQPRAFAEIVACVGPIDRPWPSDVELLAAVFEPTPERIARWAGAKLRARRAALFAGAAMLIVGAGVVGGAKWWHPQQPPAPKMTAELARAALSRTLESSVPGRLQVTLEQSTLVVSGLVETPQEAATVRAAVETAALPFPVVQRFAVASEVAEAIRSSVGLADAQVSHTGAGVFAFIGEAPDPQAVRAAISRVAADLGPAVRRIDATLEQTKGKPVKVDYLSTLTTDGLSVVHTRDGVKHVVVNPVEPELMARDALSIH